MSDDLRRLAADLASSGDRVRRGLSLAVNKTAADIEGDAKIYAPVRTGNLKGSIGYDVTENRDGASAEIGPTANYGHFVEHGTSRMAPQPYLGPAFDRRIGVFEQAIGQVVDGSWKG